MYAEHLLLVSHMLNWANSSYTLADLPKLRYLCGSCHRATDTIKVIIEKKGELYR